MERVWQHCHGNEQQTVWHSKTPRDLCLRLGLTEQEHADPASLAWSKAAPELDNLFTSQVNEDIRSPNGSAGQLQKPQGTTDTLHS